MSFLNSTTRTYVGAKLHGIRVTDKHLRYEGSVAIDADLMRAVGIAPYEQVHVVNLNNGERWITYALPATRVEGQLPVFSLNGGGARLGEIGDECVVLTYTQSDSFEGALVLHLDADNAPVRHVQYPSKWAQEVDAGERGAGVPK